MLSRLLTVTAMIAALCLTSFSVGEGALAMNNYFGLRQSQVLAPQIVLLLISVVRYHILDGVIAVTILLLLISLMRKSEKLQSTGTILTLGILVFAHMPFVIFSIKTGACLCADWRDWERHEHKTYIEGG